MASPARIARLRALIDHPATGPAERAAAERMLDRALGAAVRPLGDRTYGPRHGVSGRHSDLATIADLIRADLAFARVFTAAEGTTEPDLRHPVRDAPAGIGYTVEQPFAGKIIVTLDGVPDDWGLRPDGTATAALRELADEIVSIMNAYNCSGPDVGPRFFAGVRTSERTLVW